MSRPNNSHKWNDSEIELIRDQLKQNKIGKEIHKLLPHIRFWEVIEKIKDLRETPIHKIKWKPEENQLLIDSYLKGIPKKDILPLLPNKSNAAIRAKLRDIRLNHEYNWTEKNITLLTELLSKGKGYKEISNILKCGQTAVSQKCFEMGFTSVKAFKQRIQCDLRKEGKKKCFRCDTVKNIEDFGYRLENCTECTPAYLLKKRHQQSLVTKIRIKLGAARHKMKKRNLPFEVTEHDILELWEKQKQKCYYTGREMNYIHSDPNCFSIERLDSLKGYTKDNIVLIITWLNLFKKDLHYEVFIQMCKDIYEHHKSMNQM